MSGTRLDHVAAPGGPAAPSDEELLAGLAAGRLEALDALYERYKTMAYGIARRITGDDSLAEDVVQEAFLGAWRSADRYVAGRGSVRTWLLAIVHHRSIDSLRRRRATSELPDAEQSASTPAALTLPDVWQDVAAALDREAIQQAMGTITVSQSEAIELAYLGCMTPVVIAEWCDRSPGTVNSRM